jgi:hypothetical protein
MQLPMPLVWSVCRHAVAVATAADRRLRGLACAGALGYSSGWSWRINLQMSAQNGGTLPTYGSPCDQLTLGRDAVDVCHETFSNQV